MSGRQRHPASFSAEELAAECEFQRTRRGGPGGQHRNKVESAIVATHRPTGAVGQASERRSQHENRREALARLRVNLALAVRMPIPSQADFQPVELWRTRVQGRRINVSATHDDFPALLAEALDVMACCDFDAAASATMLDCSSSQLIRFLKKEAAAFQMVNQGREKLNLPAYR